MPAFHANGRPRRWLREILFQPNGHPRPRLRMLVQHKNGRPRSTFREWMEETTARRAEALRPRLWFFMGDTLDWLSDHAHVTGVGRVTIELFLGGLDGARPPLWYPVVAGGGGVRRWRPDKAGQPSPQRPAGEAALRMLLDSVPQGRFDPQPDDHVLFTGVVWTAHYVRLFRQLTIRKISFSVLVHDIIPILEPDYAEPRQREEFIEWMEEVVRGAQVIFVSCASVRSEVEAWCATRGLVPKAVVVIPFGPSIAPAAETRGTLRPEISAPFVLSVGTIDRRKNQTFLCHVWRRLLDEMGAAALPMLVLVGRDDLDLAASDDAMALAAANRIAVLSDVDDAELDKLYRSCLFTAFPSRMEGYGLPVADSLAYGKLPVTSDLSHIRDYAGDLPFYFDPTHERDACRALRHAIEDMQEREAAERRIAQWRPGSWREAADAIYRPLAHLLVARDRIGKLLPSLKLEVPRQELHRLAERWCMAPTPDVSILIINWNAATLTRACLDHIHAHTSGVTYEVLIADNGSTRADLAVLHDLGPGVRMFPLGVNRFFGEANNILAERAKGRLLCLLNNDVFVRPGWLERLSTELSAHPEAAAAGPVFLFPNETVQEAGGTLDITGIPLRQLRGAPASTIVNQPSSVVDYVSAAALLVRTQAFIAAGGFDLAFEPAYYEDTDLCFKLAALGYVVRLCPEVTVTHLEGYSTDEHALSSTGKKALGDLNRTTFLARWGAYLANRSPAALGAARGELLPDLPSAAPLPSGRALLYTPFDLTPGGGERYLLTLASALTDRFAVTIMTAQPYSALRLRTLGKLFGIDLSTCAPASEYELPDLPAFDLMVTMGNFAIPPVPGSGTRNFYHCQFPFPPSRDDKLDPQAIERYEAVVVNSQFTRAAVEARFESLGLPSKPVVVANPPVPQFNGDATAKKLMILSVGRFFVGGHSKRHDLLIEAFRTLHPNLDGNVQLHLAGSSTPGRAHMAYLQKLQAAAADLPVVFHVNCSSCDIADLYRDAAIYWHGTGLGADLTRRPELAEHFGIAIVEAMSAQCVVLALNAGGAQEIIHDGIDGFLYADARELVAKTAQLLTPDAAGMRTEIGRRAGDRAADYTPAAFAARISELIA